MSEGPSALDLRAATAPREVVVHAAAGARNYPVLVGRGLLGQLDEIVTRRVAAHRWVVISDVIVGKLYGEAVVARFRKNDLDATLLSFPAGERNKTRETWARLSDDMLAHKCGRDTVVVALGGGVTGDLAGFVAASFLRGVPVVQVPTSLVAMIDASVGGKTGVDTPAGKNLVGAFHPPVVVVADPETTGTLPREERAQGLVEAVKHGAIADERYLSELERDLRPLLDGDVEATERAVLRSIEIKAGVVSRDEREGGERQVLNFGHTIGHALEAASDYRLSHGSAVGLGMILEARLGERLGVTSGGTAERLRAAVQGLELPTTVPPGIETGRALDFLASDKKRVHGRVRCVLLRGAGEVDASAGFTRDVEVGEIERLIEDARAR